MLEILKPLRASPGLRVCALGVFLFGISTAATGPYLSVVAIRELGLSDFAYSALFLASSIVNVAASIGLGILADRDSGYRKLMMALGAIGFLGYAAIFLFPSPIVFALSLLLPVSIYGGLMSLLFAAGRTFSAGLPSADRLAMSSTLRGMFSAAWILVPGLIGLALAGSPSMLPAFGIAALAALASMILIGRKMPPGAAGDPSRRPPKVSLPAALRLLANPAVALRVLGCAAVTAALQTHGSVMPLIMTGQAGGRPADVGIAWGIIAGMELVCLFFWAKLAAKIGTAKALACAMGLYLFYLALVATAASPVTIISGAVLGGSAASAIITLPIGYVQELIAGRPGLAASLIAMNQFLAGVIMSSLFALGSHLGPYPLVLAFGAAAGLCGALALLLLDRFRPMTFEETP